MKLIVFLSLFLFSCSLACIKRPVCESGWTLINRTLGGWCVKLLPTYYNMSMAIQTCAKVGAVLSSVESDTELTVEENLANEQNMTIVLLGSQLRPECVCTNFTVYNSCPFNSTSTCTLYNAFVWTDNFTVGDSMMSELYPGETWPYYLEYVVISAYGTTEGLYTTSDALMAYYQESNVFGALCGKKAT